MDDEFKERSKMYFCKLFNVEHKSNIVLDAINSQVSDRIKYIKNIRVGEIKDAMMNKVGKGVGRILIENWKYLGDERIWLTKLFYSIICSRKKLDEWRKSIVVHIYKNKGDIQLNL